MILVMYNVILSELNHLDFSSWKTNAFQQHTKAFEIALLADARVPPPPYEKILYESLCNEYGFRK